MFAWYNKKKSNTALAIDNDVITVNNFFAHWITEISITRYREDIAILLLNNVVKIYCYSKSMLKHLPEKSLQKFQNELLYSNKRTILKDGTIDRRENSANDVKDLTKLLTIK